jgi:hypothetical protein
MDNLFRNGQNSRRVPPAFGRISRSLPHVAYRYRSTRLRRFRGCG